MPILPAALTPTAPPASGDAFSVRLLTELYNQQLALTPHDEYLREHARAPVVAGQVAAFRWYRRFLPPTGTVLDWGCNHSPDSCLLRAWAADRYELHACDFRPADDFPAFRHFAQNHYSQLNHLYQLPYGHGQIDAVIASGVLEHTAMDYESLKELHRVLKPGGVLVVTYLPNRWSVAEWVRRNVYRKDYHRRLYGRAETRRMLLHTGFDVFDDRHQLELRDGWLGTAARTVPGLAALSSVLCFAARKVTCV